MDEGATGERVDDAVDPLVREQLIRQRASREDRRDTLVRGARQVAVFSIFVVLLAFAYTGYKAFGEAIDDAQTDWWAIGSILPRTDDINMPPILDIIGEFGEDPGGAGKAFTWVLIDEGAFTLREATVGFLVGVAIGLAIAVLLVSSKRLEKGLLPYVIASQTIPLIAIAPIIVVWGRKNFDVFPWEWQDWMSVSVIATYLTFFPVAVNGLRGLQSPKPENMELMQSYASSWGQTLWRLRLPAALPFLFVAFKIAATSSIVGAIVGEISAGVEGGLGRRILLEAQRYTTGPERLYVAVVGAAVLGIIVFLGITLVERLVLGRQGREAVT